MRRLTLLICLSILITGTVFSTMPSVSPLGSFGVLSTESTEPTAAEVELLRQHIAAVNETDPARQKEVIAHVYAPDVTLIDPFYVAQGAEKLASLYDQIHQLFPGSVFRIAGVPDVHHGIARLRWGQGEPRKSAVHTGEDIVVIRNGRIQEVYVFIDGQGK